AHPTRNVFDLVTLVIFNADLPRTGLSPEKLRIIELCRGGALSVAEIAGHLGLPTGITKVLLSDLVDEGHLTTRAGSGTPDTGNAKVRLLQEVLDGLRATL